MENKYTDFLSADIQEQMKLFRRKDVLPSERAKAYHFLNETLKEKDLNGTHIEVILEKTLNYSSSTIYKYIRLNYLNVNLLNLVDQDKLCVSSAVELSYLNESNQYFVYEYFFVRNIAKLTIAMAPRIRKAALRGKLTERKLESIIKKKRK